MGFPRGSKFAACCLDLALCLPFDCRMPDYENQRERRTPPHVSLRSLRKASNQTLEQVCATVSEILGLPPERPFVRGSLSAIESGLRGPSQAVLDALAVAYGLDPGDVVTDFEPRKREVLV